MKDERRWLSYKPREKAGEELHHNLRLDSGTRQSRDSHRYEASSNCSADQVSMFRVRHSDPAKRIELAGAEEQHREEHRSKLKWFSDPVTAAMKFSP